MWIHKQKGVWFHDGVREREGGTDTIMMVHVDMHVQEACYLCEVEMMMIAAR